MPIQVHLDSTRLRFYRDAPENYCHFVLGNLVEVFIALHEQALLGVDIELTHDNPSPRFADFYAVFSRAPARAVADAPPGARSIELSESVDWQTLEPKRDLARYLPLFRTFIGEHVLAGVEPAATQVTWVQRNAYLSNRYVIGESVLVRAMRRVCAQHEVALQVVDFDGMTFAQQVELMSRTRVLIGIHGAGLVNSLFLPAGAAVVELSPHPRFDARFFRFTGMAKGNRWIRVIEPSWSVPSLYNLLLALIRAGHTRTNRYFRDRNAAYDPASVARALAHALAPAGEGAAGSVDVELNAAERSRWRQLRLLPTHRKFVFALACATAASVVFATSPVFWLTALVCVALAFFA